MNNAGTVGAATVVMGYGYNAVNNLTVVTDTINGVLGGVKLNSYDALNRVVRMTQSGVGVAEKRIDLAYDAASQMTSLTRYRDLAGMQLVATSDYSFDGNGRLTNLTHHRGGTVLADYGFVYDAVNRITQMTSADGVSNYDYDLTNQLTGADYNYQTDETYSYDANGNRTNAGYGTGTYNQLLTDGIYTYEYDAEGNRTKRTEIATGEVTEYLWDYRNRLTAVTTKTAAGVVTRQVNYSYDANNQRIAKVVDLDGAGAATPTTERFVYDDKQISLTFDGAGTQTERFFHGPMIDQVIAQEGPGGLVYWALTDHQGSVRDVLNSSGQVVNHLIYDSFGKITSETNPAIEFRFSYTGREFDGETGQYYYRARYYDASVGRFLSEDPIGFSSGDIPNLYTYVSNNSLGKVDPTGTYSTNLQILLSITQEGLSKRVRAYPSSKDYGKALIKATNWFYLITEPDKRTRVPEASMGEKNPWVLTAPLVNTSDPKNHGGKANLRPFSSSRPIVPTIDLLQDDRRKKHQTPGYSSVEEIKFPYRKGKEEKSPICPELKPRKEPEVEDALPDDDRKPFKFPEINWPEIDWPPIWPIIRNLFGGQEQV